MRPDLKAEVIDPEAQDVKARKRLDGFAGRYYAPLLSFFRKRTLAPPLLIPDESNLPFFAWMPK
jgi:hypothetical protein